MGTKVTTASIRIALSHNYSTFEVTSNIENPDGISVDDIREARKNCQLLASEAVNEYKSLPNANSKEELKRIENKLSEIRKMVNGEQKEKPDTISEEEILAKPMYEKPEPPAKPVKKQAPKKSKK